MAHTAMPIIGQDAKLKSSHWKQNEKRIKVGGQHKQARTSSHFISFFEQIQNLAE